MGQAFADGYRARSGECETRGDHAYSYDMLLAWREQDTDLPTVFFLIDPEQALNRSVTTSRHWRGIVGGMAMSRIGTVNVRVGDHLLVAVPLEIIPRTQKEIRTWREYVEHRTGAARKA